MSCALSLPFCPRTSTGWPPTCLFVTANDARRYLAASINLFPYEWLIDRNSQYEMQSFLNSGYRLKESPLESERRRKLVLRE
jgi:hypothetical protein